MRVELIKIPSEEDWQEVKNRAMNTIGKENGKHPPSDWKRGILLAEHSPIRSLMFTIRLVDIPYWVSTHLVRHKIGVEHFVSTQRTDRTGINRNDLPQSAPVSHTMVINAQALINISRKRMCNQAARETGVLWFAIINKIALHEPELASICVPECVYRGFCPEMKSCGFVKTERYAEWVERYRA